MKIRRTLRQTGIPLETDPKKRFSCVGESSPRHVHSTACAQVLKTIALRIPGRTILSAMEIFRQLTWASREVFVVSAAREIVSRCPHPRDFPSGKVPRVGLNYIEIAT